MKEEYDPKAEEEPPYVYVIEDDDVQRRGLASYLSREGYVVKVFADGESAIKTIRDDQIYGEQLVICDYRLPGLHGLEVLAEISGILDADRFILISAYLTDELSAKAIEKGVTRALEKPVILEQLVEECKDALSKGRKEAARRS